MSQVSPGMEGRISGKQISDPLHMSQVSHVSRRYRARGEAGSGVGLPSHCASRVHCVAGGAHTRTWPREGGRDQAWTTLLGCYHLLFTPPLASSSARCSSVLEAAHVSQSANR